MSKNDLDEIYQTRWEIEYTYKTLKQRLQIQNYTAQTNIRIKQDIYATFLIYNLFFYSRIYLNLLINKYTRKENPEDYYDVNQSNLISRLKIDNVEPILKPAKINEFTKKHNRKMLASPQQSKRTQKIRTKNQINQKKNKNQQSTKFLKKGEIKTNNSKKEKINHEKKS